jgi:hypothetical protein
MAMVLFVGGWPIDFWGMWYQGAARMVVGTIDLVAKVLWWVVVGSVILWRRWWRLIVRDVVMWQRWRVGIDGMLHLIKRRFLPLFLLAKDVDVVL